MNDRGWEELVDLLDQKFDITEHKKYSEPLEGNQKLEANIESLEFEKDGDTYRVSRITSPTILDKKTFYHKAGISEHTEYVYDPEEKSNKVVFYKQQSGEWEEFPPEKLFSNN